MKPLVCPFYLKIHTYGPNSPSHMQILRPHLEVNDPSHIPIENPRQWSNPKPTVVLKSPIMHTCEANSPFNRSFEYPRLRSRICP